MAKIQTGNELGMAILEALGIPSDKVAGVSIDMEPGRLASVTVVRHVDSDEAQKLVMELQKYDLVRQEDRVALPVVNMGMDKASGPDMTVVGARSGVVEPEGQITIVNRLTDRIERMEQRRTEEGRIVQVIERAKADLDKLAAIVRGERFAQGGPIEPAVYDHSLEAAWHKPWAPAGDAPHVNVAAPTGLYVAPTEPTAEDPMEATRALVKKHGGGSGG